MPYVRRNYRKMLLPENFKSCIPEEPGGLNFLISALMNEYIELNGLNYSTINEVMGAIESAKQEFYRRVAIPYEDDKIVVNGDMYSCVYGYYNKKGAGDG